MDHAGNGFLERITHNLRKCGERNRQTETPAGKRNNIDGSASLVQSLMGTDLIDEYRFLVQPFIMGRGRRFFPDGTPPTKLRLVESKMVSGGTLALIYQPDKK